MRRRAGAALKRWRGPALVALLAALSVPFPTSAQLLPQGFLDGAPVATGTGSASIEADTLVFDAQTNTVIAEGGAVFRFDGYELTGDRLIYQQSTGEVTFEGNVRVVDPQGVVTTVDRLAVTGQMKQAFLETLTITTPDGSLVTAADVNYTQALETVLTQASYAPCGECIDAKGNRIGWRVKAARIVYDTESKIIYLEQPTLELLGIPVAWLPMLAFPDPTEFDVGGLQMPSYGYTDKMGLFLDVPYFHAAAPDLDLIITPRLMSRQGFLLAVGATQRFSRGTVSAKVSGVYQLDRSAFAGQVGDRDWRGAIQTSSEFTPVDRWQVGWSYVAFTDAAYLGDYLFTDAKSSVNQVYASYLDDERFFDIRIQQFNQLGNVTQAEQGQQGLALPNARFDAVHDLSPGWGRINVAARLLGVRRELDMVSSPGGVPYVFGYAGDKVHGSVEAAWQNRVIGPAGLVFTPHAGGRLDAAYYNGGSALLPGAVSLLTATPIAAIDVRWPLFGSDDWGNTHIVEPIAQLVYRASSVTTVGITNDDAQSFVFEDTNLFDYNRFSGSDRQETGLRANLGARYQANLANGGYVDLIAGQSFHIAGSNALGIVDHAQTGNSSGLGVNPSYMVAGATAQLVPNIRVGGKVQVDPATWRVTRAGGAVHFSNADRYALDLDYVYLAATPERGIATGQHEVFALGSVPVFDYWTAQAGLAWDLATNQWLEARAGLVYDDRYLTFGANAVATGPTHATPNDRRFTVSFGLKGPGGLNLGFNQ